MPAPRDPRRTLSGRAAEFSLPKTVLICGASARAAAFSAIRAGIVPICADLFADEDLAAVAKTARVENYPHGLPATVNPFPAAPWIYTGALENHPAVVEQISAARPLLGNCPASLAKARNHGRIAQWLEEAGLPCLTVRTAGNPPPPDGRWLLKPMRGTAGRGIEIWDKTTVASVARQEQYFQRRASGMSYSALYLAFPDAVLLIGVTKQLIGSKKFHAAPYAYCGSIGPMSLPPGLTETLRTIGQLIGTSCALQGLFGCDFLIEDQSPRLTEVNPRYTASVEIYERAWNIPLLAWHCQACGERATEESLDRFRRQLGQARTRGGPLSGKAILFAPRSVVVPPFREMVPKRSVLWRPSVADIPQVGTQIAAERPICTVFAEGDDEESCADHLSKSAHDIYANF